MFLFNLKSLVCLYKEESMVVCVLTVRVFEMVSTRVCVMQPSGKFMITCINLFLFLFFIWPLNNYKYKQTVCQIDNMSTCTKVNTKQEKQ